MEASKESPPASGTVAERHRLRSRGFIRTRREYAPRRVGKKVERNCCEYAPQSNFVMSAARLDPLGRVRGFAETST